MKAMDRADGVLASLSLGTCVRKECRLSSELPPPRPLHSLLQLDLCPQGTPYCNQQKKVQEESLDSPAAFSIMFVLRFGNFLNKVAN